MARRGRQTHPSEVHTHEDAERRSNRERDRNVDTMDLQRNEAARRFQTETRETFERIDRSMSDSEQSFSDEEISSHARDIILQDFEPDVGSGDPAGDREFRLDKNYGTFSREEFKKKRSPEERNLYAQYIIAGASFASALAAIATFTQSITLYLVAKLNADGRANDLPGVLSDAELKRLVQAWKDRPDKELWRDVAHYVEVNVETVSMLDERNMLNIIMLMSTDTGWIWESTDAFNVAVNQFVADINEHKNTADAYRNVMERKYSQSGAAPGTPPSVLPRREAARVLGQAVTRFLRVTQS